MTAAGVDDAALVAGVRAGDERALDALMVRYHAPLHAFVRQYVGVSDIADDVLQEVFIRIWDARTSLDPQRPVRAYLYTAARHAAMNLAGANAARRRREGEYANERPAVQSDSHATIEQDEMAHLVRDAVARLPERCREVFVLAREHGLSYPEVASVLGVTTGTVKTQMARAVVALARALGPFLTVVVIAGRA